MEENLSFPVRIEDSVQRIVTVPADLVALLVIQHLNLGIAPEGEVRVNDVAGPVEILFSFDRPKAEGTTSLILKKEMPGAAELMSKEK